MANSRIVTSNQQGVHDNLEAVVTRHLQSTFRKPIADHTRRAFESLLPKIDGKTLVLDSGCGNGASTERLARLYPDHLIIGIDKSQHRLAKNEHNIRESDSSSQPNFILVRADIIDFWRLASAAGIKVARHFLLYPNPWPKSQHLQRRWHGSPVFADLLKLGGKLELRSNWQTYVQEFGEALSIAGVSSQISGLQPETGNYLTDFEAKYDRSGHKLWQLNANLDVDIALPDSQNQPGQLTPQ